MLKSAIRWFLQRCDYDILQLSSLEATQAMHLKRKLLAQEAIDLVIDIGANMGQFGSFMRGQVGYKGDMISYEPLVSAYQSLSRTVAGDNRWQSVNLALGDSPGKSTIHIAGNSQSSSLLGMLDRHRESEPASAYIGMEQVLVSTLDIQFHDLKLSRRRAYLKIDTQGFEQAVLRGAEQSLAQVMILELEMSFVPLYEGQVLFTELNNYVGNLGFVMVGIEPVFRDPASGEILQADVVFRRLR